jgi:hypothetical protein
MIVNTIGGYFKKKLGSRFLRERIGCNSKEKRYRKLQKR